VGKTETRKQIVVILAKGNESTLSCSPGRMDDTNDDLFAFFGTTKEPD